MSIFQSLKRDVQQQQLKRFQTGTQDKVRLPAVAITWLLSITNFFLFFLFMAQLNEMFFNSGGQRGDGGRHWWAFWLAHDSWDAPKWGKTPGTGGGLISRARWKMERTVTNSRHSNERLKKKITPQATFPSLLLKFNTSLQQRCRFCFCLCGGQLDKHQSERHLHIRRTQELYTDPSLYSVWRWATAAQDHVGCYELRLQFTWLHQNWKIGGWRNVC